MGQNLNQFTRLEPDVPYKAFSGADIQAVINNKPIGSLQSVTVSITRETAALYGFGSASPKAFVKGKRGIAGTLVFTQFDRDPIIYDVANGVNQVPLNQLNQAAVVSRFADVTADGDLLTGQLRSTMNWSNNVQANINQTFGGKVADDFSRQLATVYQLAGARKIRYADELPEFDITLSMINSAGDAAYIVIGGVEIVNQGQGWSLEDLTSEAAYTYVARYITPLTSITQAPKFAQSASLLFKGN
jgi:hypothetical protein